MSSFYLLFLINQTQKKKIALFESFPIKPGFLSRKRATDMFSTRRLSKDDMIFYPFSPVSALEEVEQLERREEDFPPFKNELLFPLLSILVLRNSGQMRAIVFAKWFESSERTVNFFPGRIWNFATATTLYSTISIS